MGDGEKNVLMVLMVVALLIVGQMPVTAMAYGTNNEHSRKTNETVRSLCNTVGCNEAGEHQHGSRYYYGHSMDDDHDYHAVCNVKECAEITKHEHESNTIDNNGNGHHNSNHNRRGHHH